MKRATLFFRRVLLVSFVVIVCAFASAMIQYVAQHEPGTKAAYAARQLLVELQLPSGASYRLPASHLERRRELDRAHGSSLREDGTFREEYEPLWDAELALFRHTEQGQRLAAWREHDWASAPGAEYTDFFDRRAQQSLIVPFDWAGVLVSSARHVARTPGDIVGGLGGGSTLSHPPAMGFLDYHDEDGFLAEGTCFIADYSTIESTLDTIGFLAPTYFTVLTSLGPVWYAIYHVALVLFVWVAVALLARVRREGLGPGRTTLSRTMVLSSMLALPLPALFEVVWKTWWAYRLVRDESTGVYTDTGLVLTSPGLHAVWAGIVILHAMIVLSVIRGGEPTEQHENPPRENPTIRARLWTFMARRWWQLVMVAASLVLLGAPLLLGWANRAWNEGAF